jgi:WD40 repeat protein
MGAHEVAACYVGHQLLTSVAWQPGTSLIVAGGANGMATWDAGDRSCPWQPITEEDVWDLGFSRDGSRLAIGSYHARIVDARTWRPLPPPLRPGPLTGIGTETLSVSLDPAGDRLAFAATGLHAVGLYDVAGRGVVETVDLPASPTAVRWSPDGSTLAVAAADGLVRLYDASLRPLGQLPVARLPTALAWSPSGAALAVGDEGGRVALVDAGRPGHPVLAAAIAHEGAVRALAFSPDGRRLASAGSDDVARIWTADGLTPAMTLAGDTAGIWGVQWSPDSSRVVTASADGSLGLWSV